MNIWITNSSNLRMYKVKKERRKSSAGIEILSKGEQIRYTVEMFNVYLGPTKWKKNVKQISLKGPFVG